jgi:hypothetical protein
MKRHTTPFISLPAPTFGEGLTRIGLLPDCNGTPTGATAAGIRWNCILVPPTGHVSALDVCLPVSTWKNAC